MTNYKLILIQTKEAAPTSWFLELLKSSIWTYNYKCLSKHQFSGLLMCMNCGGLFKRKYWNYGFSSEHVVLQCTSQINSSSKCNSGAINLKTLEECTSKVINELFELRKDIVSDMSPILSKVIRVNDVDRKV